MKRRNSVDLKKNVDMQSKWSIDSEMTNDSDIVAIINWPRRHEKMLNLIMWDIFGMIREVL